MLGLQAALFRCGLLPLLRRSICASVKDDVTAAQNELDEFFGAQYHAPDSAHSISSAPSVLAAVTPASTSHTVGTARDVRDQDSQLSHVDASGRASMVEVAHVRSPTSQSASLPTLPFKPQVSQESGSYSPLLSVTPVVEHVSLRVCGTLLQCFHGHCFHTGFPL